MHVVMMGVGEGGGWQGVGRGHVDRGALGRSIWEPSSGVEIGVAVVVAVVIGVDVDGNRREKGRLSSALSCFLWVVLVRLSTETR